MEVLLASWVTEDIMGVQTESLADVDGRLTVFIEKAPDRQPHICENEEDALEWVYSALEISREGFTAKDALFGRFPQLIDELGAKLANSIYRQGGTDFADATTESFTGCQRPRVAGATEVVETLYRKQGKYIKDALAFLEGTPTFTCLPSRELSEEDALKWINNSKNDKASELTITIAGAAVFPDFAKELEKSGKDVKAKHDVSIDR